MHYAVVRRRAVTTVHNSVIPCNKTKWNTIPWHTIRYNEPYYSKWRPISLFIQMYRVICLGGALWRYFQRPWIAPEDLIPNPVVSSWWFGDLLLCQELLPFTLILSIDKGKWELICSIVRIRGDMGDSHFGEIQGERVPSIEGNRRLLIHVNEWNAPFGPEVPGQVCWY